MAAGAVQPRVKHAGPQSVPRALHAAVSSEIQKSHDAVPCTSQAAAGQQTWWAHVLYEGLPTASRHTGGIKGLQ